MNQDQISLLERIQAPTPKIFRIVRNAGIVLAVASGAVMSLHDQGIALPELVTFLADKAYVLAGAIAAIVAQLTVDYKAKADKEVFTK